MEPRSRLAVAEPSEAAPEPRRWDIGTLGHDHVPSTRVG